MDRHLFTNRLIQEKSPYLLQHAHNPVEWYPWGEEAFNAAQAADKPIFLSIGYATCHWCHTMERECFENVEIAKRLNETFICIKVDREELPEIDAIYMDFAQSMMAGSAGWPLNVLLTPKLEPFFAATYLPPVSRQGMLGLNDLIQKIQTIWESEEREKVEEQASKIVEVFNQNLVSQGDTLPSKDYIAQAAEMLFKVADPVYGGLRGAPKFPVGYQYNFLLNYSSQFKEGRALFLAERTLDMMHRGGIYDHIGGGFSRYSVDERWHVPHFEKMLYDNALLADSYIEAWRFTKKPLYKQVAKEILDYVLRAMTHAEGGFYSGEDADSEGHEGRFYTWTYTELEHVLGKERLKIFAEFYDVLPEGNFEGRNVLNTPLPIEEFAIKHALDHQALEDELKAMRKELFEVREKREHPFKDDKILTSWNGLMIHALAEAGSAFQEESYLKAAVKGMHFIKTHLWDGQKLGRRWRDGQTMHRGVLDDYAFLIRALLTLFERMGEFNYLQWAIQLTIQTESLFKVTDGAFFQSDGQDPAIILRKCQFSDGAEPSGNAIHGENLIRLYQMTGEIKYLNQAEDIFRSIQASLDQYAPGFFYHIMNLSRYYDRQAPTLFFALNSQSAHFETLKKALGEHYLPHGAVVFVKENLPLWQEYKPKQGQTTLYLCRQGHCEEPITDIHKMLEVIQMC